MCVFIRKTGLTGSLLGILLGFLRNEKQMDVLNGQYFLGLILEQEFERANLCSVTYI